MVNAMREQMDDFKLMNTLRKRPMASTVHQFNVREAKYIQKRGEVTEQMRIVSTFTDAYAEEKLAATISVLRTAEKFSFHGDSTVVPREFDGLPAQI
jgi:hypothetical protein